MRGLVPMVCWSVVGGINVSGVYRGFISTPGWLAYPTVRALAQRNPGLFLTSQAGSGGELGHG